MKAVYQQALDISERDLSQVKEARNLLDRTSRDRLVTLENYYQQRVAILQYGANLDKQQLIRQHQVDQDRMTRLERKIRLLDTM